MNSVGTYKPNATSMQLLLSLHFPMSPRFSTAHGPLIPHINELHKACVREAQVYWAVIVLTVLHGPIPWCLEGPANSNNIIMYVHIWLGARLRSFACIHPQRHFYSSFQHQAEISHGTCFLTTLHKLSPEEKKGTKNTLCTCTNVLTIIITLSAYWITQQKLFPATTSVATTCAMLSQC